MPLSPEQAEQNRGQLLKIIPEPVRSFLTSTASEALAELVALTKLSNKDLLSGVERSSPGQQIVKKVDNNNAWLVLARSHPTLTLKQLLTLYSKLWPKAQSVPDLLQRAADVGRLDFYEHVLQWHQERIKQDDIVTSLQHAIDCGHLELARGVFKSKNGPQLLQACIHAELEQFTYADDKKRLLFLDKKRLLFLAKEAGANLKDILKSSNQEKCSETFFSALFENQVELLQLLFENMAQIPENQVVVEVRERFLGLLDEKVRQSGSLRTVQWLLNAIDTKTKEDLFSNSSDAVFSSVRNAIHLGHFDVVWLLLKEMAFYNKDKKLLIEKFDDYYKQYEDIGSSYFRNYLPALHYLLSSDPAVLAYAKNNPWQKDVVQAFEAHQHFLKLLKPLEEHISTHLKKYTEAKQEAEGMMEKLTEAARAFYTQPLDDMSWKTFERACKAAYAEDQYPELKKHRGFLGKVAVLIKNFFKALKERICGTTLRTYGSFWDSRTRSEVIVDALKGQLEEVFSLPSLPINP